MPDSSNQNDLETPETLARLYGVTVPTIRRWVREGRIPSIRPTRKVLRFRLTDVERALACPATPSTQEVGRDA